MDGIEQKNLVYFIEKIGSDCMVIAREDKVVTHSEKVVLTHIRKTLLVLHEFVRGLSRIHKKYFYFTMVNFGTVWIVTFSYLTEIPGLSLEVTGFVKVLTSPVFAIFVFMDMYHCWQPKPTTAPHGFTLIKKYWRHP